MKTSDDKNETWAQSREQYDARQRLVKEIASGYDQNPPSYDQAGLNSLLRISRRLARSTDSGKITLVAESREAEVYDDSLDFFDIPRDRKDGVKEKNSTTTFTIPEEGVARIIAIFDPYGKNKHNPEHDKLREVLKIIGFEPSKEMQKPLDTKADSRKGRTDHPNIGKHKQDGKTV